MPSLSWGLNFPWTIFIQLQVGSRLGKRRTVVRESKCCSLPSVLWGAEQDERALFECLFSERAAVHLGIVPVHICSINHCCLMCSPNCKATMPYHPHLPAILAATGGLTGMPSCTLYPTRRMEQLEANRALAPDNAKTKQGELTIEISNEFPDICGIEKLQQYKPL